MLLFPIPAPFAIILIIPIVCVGVYYVTYVKFNKYEINKFERLERLAIKITNIVMIYLIIMAVFRNDSVAAIWVGLLGVNIALCLLYICVIPAFLLFKGQNNNSNLYENQKYENVTMLKIKNNYKRGLYCLIGAILSIRFIFISYLANSSSVSIRILIAFIFLFLMQYYYNQNWAILKNQGMNNFSKFSMNKNMLKSLSIGLVLLMTIVFMSGKVFKTEAEKKAIQRQQEMKNFQREIFGK